MRSGGAVTCAGDDVYAVGGDLDVGDHSLVVRERGGIWRQARSPIQCVLLAVASRADGAAVRAVGFNGGAIELTDDGWREISVGTPVRAARRRLGRVRAGRHDRVDRGRWQRPGRARRRRSPDVRRGHR